MNNKKILTGLLLTTIVVGWIWATFASDTTNSWTTNTNKVFNWLRAWMGKFMGAELTDAEKTALEAMTDTEKQTFFETKRTTQKAKIEAHENVIDKLLAWSTLTSEEEAVKAEIIKVRAERKLEREAREAEMEAIQPILEKKRNWETLTTDEQTKLDAFESNRPGKWWMRWRWMHR